MPTSYPALKVRKKEERRLLEGHPWAFSNELIEVRKDIEAGAIVRLEREQDGKFIGLGLYNPKSLIAVRILTHLDEEIDDDFWRRRLRAAAARRELLLTRRNSARLVHGESDQLPGLIVDKFDKTISFQIASVGFEVRKQLLVELFDELWSPECIIEKNTTSLRKLEGLELLTAVHKGEPALTRITDAMGTTFESDIEAGQKTGFFLDQMENRTAMRNYVRQGDRCLDLFTNEGGFAINMAIAGAASVEAVDVSKAALEKVKNNAEINGVSSQVTTREADCFDHLKSLTQQFDVIVLDPPALVKAKKDLVPARKAYLQLNSDAMKATKPEGILLTASCSHHMYRDLFLDTIYEAGRRARRQISILEERGAGIDHPVLMAMPETKYLKVFILRVH